jgi:hypothetical protein
MRLLADENFPKPIVDSLRAGGHDVLWARVDCAGWKDVVLFRVHPATPENLGPVVRAFVESDREWTGHISIITTDGIQMLAA